MVWVFAKVLQLLLAVHHLPAFDAEDLAIRLGSNQLEAVDECGPLRQSLRQACSV